MGFMSDKIALEARIKAALDRIEAVRKPDREAQELRRLEKEAENMERKAEILEEQNNERRKAEKK